jgi:NDP-sugar pyrophosphorylase family protein
MCVGYLGEQLIERLGRSQFGIDIEYSSDGDEPLGTLGAIRRARPLLGPRFLVLYGDTYLRIDYAEATAAWLASGLPAMMTVLRNDGRWDKSNANFDGLLVTAYNKSSPTQDMVWIDYGLGGLELAALDMVDERVADLGALYHELARRRRVFGFEAKERFYEIGTPTALAETDAFLTTEMRARLDPAQPEDSGAGALTPRGVSPLP